MKLLLIFLLLITKLFAQDIRDQYDYAVKLYSEENYFDAITEFKRLLFFDSKKEYLYKANELIGLCYKYGGKYSDAVKYFTLAEINARTEIEKYHAGINIVKVNILRRTTTRARVLLDSLKNYAQLINKEEEIIYWQGWTYIFENEWLKAADVFETIGSGKQLAANCKKIDDELYSPLKAKLLSVFIPGSGQIYTGNISSGLLSLFWNVLWGYITVNAFIEDRVFDGLAVSNFLWFRFYRGNIQNAEKFAVQENLRISNDALLYLQNEYEGLKP